MLEPLRCDYRWASDRLHRFALDGMAENSVRFAKLPVTYLPYVEPQRGAGRGLLEALAARACVVITDEYPCFFLPQMVAAAAARLDVRLETVDGNGLLPLRAASSVSPTAYDFRRVLQKTLPIHLRALPLPEPLAGVESCPRSGSTTCRSPCASAGRPRRSRFFTTRATAARPPDGPRPPWRWPNCPSITRWASWRRAAAALRPAPR